MISSSTTSSSKFRRTALAAITVGIAALALTGCAGSTQAGTSAGDAATPATTVKAEGARPLGAENVGASPSRSGAPSSASKTAPAASVATAKSAAISNTTQVTNHPGGVSLKHGASDYEWYHCNDYNRITSPAGTVSAYPYGPGTWAWKNVSDSKWVSATENNLERWPLGEIQFLYTNWSAKSTHTAQVTFDCSSLYPGYGITGMQVMSVDASDATTATITWQLQATVLGQSNILSSSTWHVEYGTAPGDYSNVSPSLPYESQGPHGADPRSISLTGLTPGATYHFRVVLDVHSYSETGNVQSSFTDPNNAFTTSTSPNYIFSKADAPGYQLLEVNGSSNYTEPGSVVDTWTRTLDGGKTGANQVWTFNPDATNTGLLKNNLSGLCLEVNGSDGTVDQWTCQSGSENHRWTLVRRAGGGFALQVTLTRDLVDWKAGTYYLATQDASASVADGSALTLVTDSADQRAAWGVTGPN